MTSDSYRMLISTLIDDDPGAEPWENTATFRRRLAEVPPLVDPPVHEVPKPAGAQQRVLLLEGDEILRMVLAELLRNEEYDVIEAGSGAEALALERDRIDLAVIALELEDMSGVGALRALREAGWEGPAILTAPDPAHETIVAARHLDAELLAKPFAIDALMAAVLGGLIQHTMTSITGG